MERKKKFRRSADPAISSMKDVIQLWERTWVFCMTRVPSNGVKPRAKISVYTEKTEMSCSECTDECVQCISNSALASLFDKGRMMQGRVR